MQREQSSLATKNSFPNEMMESRLRGSSVPEELLNQNVPIP